MTTYFGFAIADSMLPANCLVSKSPMNPVEGKAEIEAAVNCCNSSHKATLRAAESRFGLALVIPDKPPLVALKVGDEIIVMSVRGLPRLTEDRHYSDAEIESASFIFSKYHVVE